jgi:spore coat polysaccharide biosynthesis protein SpsF
MKVVAVVEARMGSTRLPQKTLMDIAGAPLLERVIERIRLSRTVNEIIVATSVSSGDDAIENLCSLLKVNCFRGSEDDVLERVYQSLAGHDADIVVQSGGDCPFYDPELIDLLVFIMKWGGYDYTANDMKLTFPEGIDAHIIRYEALKTSAEEACDLREREDTPRFIWNNPDRFTIYNLEAIPGSLLSRPEIRLTVDYEEDLQLTRLIYNTLYKENPRFTTFDLIRFLDNHPEWLAINSHCEQRSAAYC